MKTEEIDEALLASLKKLGPSRPRAISADAGIHHDLATKAGMRLRKQKLIIVGGSTNKRLWALPEQRIALADLIGAAKAPSTTAQRKPAKRKAKPAARRKPKRKYTRRSVFPAQPTDAASIRARAALDAEFAARLAAAPAPLDKLRIALDEYLAVLTDMRQKLVGAVAPTAT